MINSRKKVMNMKHSQKRTETAMRRETRPGRAGEIRIRKVFRLAVKNIHITEPN